MERNYFKMNACIYSNICNIRVNDDLCNELGEYCARKKQYDYEKKQKLEDKRIESEIIRFMDYQGDIGRK